MIMTRWFILALSSFVTSTLAQSNGMDMSMDTPMNLAVGNMLPYVHFTPGDTVWFLGWVPKTGGAVVGTCIGVFLLSVMERWLAACLGLAERHWVERANILRSDGINSLPSRPAPSSSSTSNKAKGRFMPFVPEFDITRGVLFAAQKFLQILLMLVVMTFQLAFILSIAMGSGVGETLFGRFLVSSHDH